MKVRTTTLITRLAAKVLGWRFGKQPAAAAEGEAAPRPPSLRGLRLPRSARRSNWKFPRPAGLVGTGKRLARLCWERGFGPTQPATLRKAA